MSTVLKIEDRPLFIEVELNGKIQLGVNARDLYKMLEVKAEFLIGLNDELHSVNSKKILIIRFTSKKTIT